MKEGERLRIAHRSASVVDRVDVDADVNIEAHGDDAARAL
jgi:hypothetical protein